MDWLVYIIAGMVTGLIAGLFGVGGGTVVVPVLAIVFAGISTIPDQHIMHMAVGTSLAVIIPTSVSSIRAHWKLDGIDWPTFRRLTAGLVVGALLGAVLADALSSAALKRVFAVFLLLVSAQMVFFGRPRPGRRLPGRLGLNGVGVVFGALSSLLGIGGGSLNVPYLAWCGMEMRRAVGTAAACGFPIAVFGAIGFIATGLNQDNLPEWSTGYVFWPAFIGIAAFSILVAPLGARLAHRLPQAVLKKIFAAFLALVGVKMLLG